MTSVDERALPPAELVPARGQTPIGVRAAWLASRLTLDTLLLTCAVLAEQLATHEVHADHSALGWKLLFSATGLLFLSFHGSYGRRVRVRIFEDVRQVVSALSLTAIGVLLLRVLVADGSQVAHQTLRLWAFAAVCLVGGRTAVDVLDVAGRRAGKVRKPTLIIGAGKVGRRVAKRLRERAAMGLQPIGFLDPSPLEVERDADEPPLLGWDDDLDGIIARHRVEQVVVTFCSVPDEVILRIVRRCEELGVEVSIVPRLFEHVTERLEIEYLGGLPLVSARRARPDDWRFALKWGLDRVFAFILLVVLSPLLVAVAVCVLVTLGRPVLFRQQRVGRNGLVFEMVKFRTMSGTDDDPSAALELPPDTGPGGVEGVDRRTRLGKLLRRACIDELPQLVNVLKGEMSLVGPRPERPHFAELFERGVYRYGDRHRVKSGITGWAQIHGLRGQTSLSDRVEWDNFYIENWSLRVDAKILLMTLPTIWRYRDTTE